MNRRRFMQSAGAFFAALAGAGPKLDEFHTGGLVTGRHAAAARAVRAHHPEGCPRTRGREGPKAPPEPERHPDRDRRPRRRSRRLGRPRRQLVALMNRRRFTAEPVTSDGLPQDGVNATRVPPSGTGSAGRQCAGETNLDGAGT